MCTSSTLLPIPLPDWPAIPADLVFPLLAVSFVGAVTTAAGYDLLRRRLLRHLCICAVSRARDVSVADNGGSGTVFILFGRLPVHVVAGTLQRIFLLVRVRRLGHRFGSGLFCELFGSSGVLLLIEREGGGKDKKVNGMSYENDARF